LTGSLNKPEFSLISGLENTLRKSSEIFWRGCRYIYMKTQHLPPYQRNCREVEQGFTKKA